MQTDNHIPRGGKFSLTYIHVPFIDARTIIIDEISNFDLLQFYNLSDLELACALLCIYKRFNGAKYEHGQMRKISKM